MHEQLYRSYLIRRRTLLRGAAISAAGAALGTAQSTKAQPLPFFSQATPETPDTYSPTTLSSEELATLNAAMDVLIPSDDLGPGAVEAGASIFLDRALGADEAPLLPLFQAGLTALDTAAGPGGMSGLAQGDREALIDELAAGNIADAPEGFFGVLLAYTRIGMFSDPVHGGNINFTGWELLRWPGIKLVWTEQDQAIDATPEPEHVSVSDFGASSNE